MTIYAAGRNVMAARTPTGIEIHASLPVDFFEPSRVNHGAYWYYWTTHDEVA
jgi:hypothetical protein